MLRPKVRLRGSWWYRCSEPSALGTGYRLLDRVHWKGQLRRHGVVIRRIDVSVEELQARGYAP